MRRDLEQLVQQDAGSDPIGPAPDWSESAKLGMWLAFLFPLVGFFIGLALIAGRDPHAHWVVRTSILVPIVLLIVIGMIDARFLGMA